MDELPAGTKNQEVERGFEGDITTKITIFGPLRAALKRPPTALAPDPTFH